MMDPATAEELRELGDPFGNHVRITQPATPGFEVPSADELASHA